MDRRTSRYRYSDSEHMRNGKHIIFANVEMRTFDAPEDIPEGEGWVTHPDLAKKPQIEPVAADEALPEADLPDEIPADGEPPKPRRGRRPKGA